MFNKNKTILGFDTIFKLKFKLFSKYGSEKLFYNVGHFYIAEILNICIVTEKKLMTPDFDFQEIITNIFDGFSFTFKTPQRTIFI